MKTIITLLTTATLALSATSAISGALAAQQDSDDSAGYALSRQAIGGFGGAEASAHSTRSVGAYASMRGTRQIHSGASNLPAPHDVQLDGR
jgi:hypothetical protein